MAPGKNIEVGVSIIILRRQLCSLSGKINLRSTYVSGTRIITICAISCEIWTEVKRCTWGQHWGQLKESNLINISNIRNLLSFFGSRRLHHI